MGQVKKTVALLVVVLTVVVGWTSVACAAPEVEGDAYVGVFSKYLWRGFDLSGGEPVAQGGVDVSASGFTLSLWGNLQLADDSAGDYSGGELNETDITLDYSFDPSELVSVSLGNVYYALDGADDTNEVYLSVGLNALLNPSLTINWDWDKSDAAGLFYVLAVSHDLEISEALSATVSARAGYNQENYSVDESYRNWHNAEFGVAADYVFSEQLSVTPSLLYSVPLSDDARDSAGIDNEFAAGLSVTYAF